MPCVFGQGVDVEGGRWFVQTYPTSTVAHWGHMRVNCLYTKRITRGLRIVLLEAKAAIAARAHGHCVMFAFSFSVYASGAMLH